MTRPSRIMATVVAASISYAGLAQTAQAGGLISAEQVVQRQAQAHAVGDERTRLLQVLDRADVAASLAARGVDADEARARVAALSDAEAAQLMAEIDRAPAGASELIGTLILVFVLLVFSDLLGFTRIFPFLRPAR
ncbi:MAG: PA2779 family protein [Rhizobacter sp.]|nr:PA2779 family protein [Rhizobacter sp.]